MTREKDREEVGRVNPGDQPEDVSPRVSFIGRVSRVTTGFDRVLSDSVPEAIEKAGRQTAESARKNIQSGQWQNYVFLAVLALVALTVIVLLARGCAGGGV